MTQGRMADLRVLITGASSGIGAAIAVRFAQEGAAVMCTGRHQERLNQTISNIEASGGHAHAMVADLTSEADVSSLVEATAKQLGGLDVVVNNAGLDSNDWADVHEWTLADYDSIMTVNVTGPFLVSKYAIPHLLEAGGGSILHISSICAVTVWQGDFAYGVSKAALNMLSDHIAVEYATRGIRSNTLMPGAIRTPLFDDVVRNHADGKAFEAAVIDRHPIRRLGELDEITDAAVLLCGREAQFMTGSNIAIDGAYSRV
jgi:NAD(P)-dependent dehydrogenase (short-subunit alcohol dehydrogenase family)